MENNEIKNDEYLLEVNDLKMYFDITTGFFKTTPLKAVDGVSIKIKKGETLGVVGESGCGKTTLGRTIMNLYNPSSGDILFDGVSISPYSDLKKIKVEKKFAVKCIKYDAKKEIKQINEDANGNDVTAKIEEVKAKALKDIEASNQSYDEKYSAKKTEILANLADVEKTKNEKLQQLSVPARDAANEAKINASIAEEKAKVKITVSEAKEIYSKELKEAIDTKNEKLAAYREEFALKLQELNKLDPKDKKKEMKAYTNDKIVAKEKIINDFSVNKSIAYGKLQDSIREANLALAAKIKELRSQDEYFLYQDTVKEINKEAHEATHQIKSSSKIRMKKFRKECTMVFQDPYSSLNPRMTVADIIAEPLDVNKLYRTKEERRSMVLELMRKVGLSPEQATRYAHEFSGGQRQRIGIARSLAVNPKFIVCDEPVSALDVSIQAQVINTFEDLQNQLGLTYLFIAHDLLVIRHISDRIAVMYLGRVVELAETNTLYDSPLHPYTISLLSAIPMPDPVRARENKRIILEGDVPSPLNVPTGCSFRTRCSRACERCKHEIPKLTEVEPGHFVSCLLVQEEKANK